MRQTRFIEHVLRNLQQGVGSTAMQLNIYTSPVCAEERCSFSLQNLLKDASQPGKSHSCMGLSTA